MNALNKNLLLLLFVVFYVIGELFKLLLMIFSYYNFSEWISFVVSTILMILLLLFYSKKVDSKNIFYLNSKQMIFLLKSILLLLCLYVIYFPVFYILIDPTHLAVDNIFFLSWNSSNNLLNDNQQILFFYFKAICLAPILEEVLFRGLLQKYLYKTKLPFIAILISTLLFSLSHYDVNKIFITFVPGLLFGFVYYKSGSLIIPILCHSAWNILCHIFPETNQPISIFPILIFVLSTVGFVLLFRNLWKTDMSELNNEKIS